MVVRLQYSMDRDIYYTGRQYDGSGASRGTDVYKMVADEGER